MIANLSQPTYTRRLEKGDALNSDIIKCIEKNFSTGVKQTKKFAQQFAGSDYTESAQNVWDFLKDHITYVKDSDHSQIIKLPSRFIHDGTGDCKSYSLAAASMLQNLGVPGVRFRYASYNSDRTPTHVYVVASDEDGNDIIVDGVWSEFNSEKQPKYKFDHAMNVYTMSGTGGGIGGETQAGIPIPSGMANILAWGKWVQDFNTAILNHQFDSLFISLGTTDKIGAWIRDQIDQVRKYEGLTAGGGLVGTIEGAVSSAVNFVVKELKVVGLSIPRQAFKGLVLINAHSLATNLKAAYTKDENAVKNTWVSLGGDWPTLRSTIDTGAKAKAIFGIGSSDNSYTQQQFTQASPAQKQAFINRANQRYNAMRGCFGISGRQAVLAACGDGIGNPLLAGLAAAAPIIAAMANFLHSIGIDTGQLVPATTEASKAAGTIQNFFDPTKAAGTGTIVHTQPDTPGFNLSSPVLWIGGGIAALLLLRK